MDDKLLYLMLFMLVTLGIGAALVLFPHRVQSRAQQWVSMGITGKIPVLQRFVNSRAYLINLRLCGLVSLLMFVVLALVAIKSR